jgi:hypothetical protein
MSIRTRTSRTALVAVLVAAMATPMSTIAAAQDAGLPEITREADHLKRVLNSIRQFDLDLKNTKLNPTSTRIKGLHTTADTARKEIGAAQATLDSLRTKLQASKFWANFDQEFEARAKKAGFSAEFLSYVRREGGAKAIIMKTNAPGAIESINDEVKSVEGRGLLDALVDQIVGVPVCAACIKCHCLFFAGAAAVLLFVPGGQPAAVGAAGAGLACATAR